MYNKWREGHLSPQNGKDMFEILEAYARDFNLNHKLDGVSIAIITAIKKLLLQNKRSRR